MRHLDVLVADNHPIYALGLQAALAEPANDYTFNVQAVANTAEEVRHMLHHNSPDVLVLDLAVPESDSLELLPAVKKNHTKTRVLVIAGSQAHHLADAAFAAGADGFMLKSGTKDELLQAIGNIVEGRQFLGCIGEAGGRDRVADFAADYGLTNREMEILRHIAQARDNFEIGAELFISHQTVSVHRKNIMRKLGVNSSAALIKIAFENRLF